MKITLRLIVSLIIVAALVASGFSYLQVQREKGNLAQELELRAAILAESLHDSVVNLLSADSPARLRRLVERFGNRKRLKGVAVYDAQGALVVSSSGLKLEESPLPPVKESMTLKRGQGGVEKDAAGKSIYVFAAPLYQENGYLGTLALFHDASYIDARLQGIWRNNFLLLLTLSFLIALTTVFIVRWSITGPIAQVADWLKGLRLGKIPQQTCLPRGDFLGPLATEVTNLAESLALARATATAREESRLRIAADTPWMAEKVKEYLRDELGEKTLFVVSNREPYMHIKQGPRIECMVPAGGLVTALDPVMQACNGVWIAHGSGSADRETSDPQGRLSVPPEEPLYTLRRIWLTKEEEEGYYYGFSNEGLWPLCHITHTRPTFRQEDWIQYQKVNEKFCEVTLEEIAHEESPLILIQDYHFALLPLLIKSKRPDARVAIFWHIPWPNPEAFGINPWKKEILLGLLGADLLGFHIQFFCNNFLQTVDRFLESKIDWEHFTVERRGQTTWVKPFPISVAFPEISKKGAVALLPDPLLREGMLKEIGVQTKYLGVGVDRIDYTKGIVERFRAVERFLEKHPEFVGQFTFVELGAPSRTNIKQYHDLVAEVEETADKINWRFQSLTWKPIIFLKAHHSHETVYRYYSVADLCMVTSLHDGMNLVAKEFVAAREDEDGVLILSEFTGASRELLDAIIVNPYDIEEMAEAIHYALLMEPEERQERMKRMRGQVRERNIYYWAGRLVSTLTRLRIPRSGEEEVLNKP